MPGVVVLSSEAWPLLPPLVLLRTLTLLPPWSLLTTAPDEFIVLADQVRTRSNMDGKMFLPDPPIQPIVPKLVVAAVGVSVSNKDIVVWFKNGVHTR